MLHKEAYTGINRRLQEAFSYENGGKAWKEDSLQDFRAAVEILSDGKDTVVVDDWGIPSVMVKIPICRNSDLLAEGSETVHPAFYSKGKIQEEICISKFQNILIDGRGYSLPMRSPAYGMDYDQALRACRAKGSGWNLSSFALRAAIALRAKKEGFFPHGNSDNSVDYFNREEHGVLGEENLVLTGSGPVTWSHNGRADGIYDLAGNLNEWDVGLRLAEGEIQIIPDGFWMNEDCTMGKECQYWRSITPEGELVSPGTPGTLKYVSGKEGILLTDKKVKDEKNTGNCAFGEIRAEKGLKVPELLYSLMLYPEDAGGHYDGWRWIKSEGECLPLCGGGYRALDHAGIFFVGMTYPRTQNYGLVGFRSIYVKQENMR